MYSVTMLGGKDRTNPAAKTFTLPNKEDSVKIPMFIDITRLGN